MAGCGPEALHHFIFSLYNPLGGHGLNYFYYIRYGLAVKGGRGQKRRGRKDFYFIACFYV